MDHSIDIEGDGTFIVDTGAGIMFNMDSKSPALRGGKLGPTSTENKAGETNVGEVASWGPNNDFPQQVVAEIKESDILRPLIRQKGKRMIGAGMAYGTSYIDDQGEEQRKAMRVAEIDQALKRTNATLYNYEAWNDFTSQGNAFAELQTNVFGDIVGVYCQDATRCRLSVKNKKNGRIEHCFISGSWAMGGGKDAEGAFTLPALDPYYDVAGQVKASNKARFILPLRLLVDDQDYYGEGVWHGLIKGGYLKLAKAIIKAKLHLTLNLNNFKYLVEVGSEFWDRAFPGFKDKPFADQKKIKEDVKDAFKKWATGQNGSTLLVDMLVDDVVQKKEYRSLWKITPMKLDIPTGAYVEDSAEVDAKIIRAFMDASLFGATPSKDRNSSGSGSDKRMAHTHELLDNAVDAELILTPWAVMADVNGWHEKYGNGQMIEFWFKGYHSATLDRTLGAISQKDPKTTD